MRGPDHPRSRGVYCIVICVVALAIGSSPLARGLPRRRIIEAALTRIIPARAGFTPRRTRKLPPTRDHPRSRGVYGFTLPIRSLLEGSSPLARGLPEQAAGADSFERIIPARAGFTAKTCLSWTLTRDHPRSRGVYVRAPQTPSQAPGSSPLARGLQTLSVHAQKRLGIIPARAGFTRRLVPARTRRRDHPRSRGVYAFILGRAGNGPRIIPARAGFTPLSTRPATRSTDHPRSRGVYRPAWRAWGCGMGSSPLARGLPPSHLAVCVSGRIIPARAGFTNR